MVDVLEVYTRPYDERFGFLFNSYYEAAGPRHARSERGLITRPGIAEVAAYREHVVTVPALGLTLSFADGEELRTEISAKFRRSGVRRELGAAGLRPLRWWTDQAGDFGLSLAVR